MVDTVSSASGYAGELFIDVRPEEEWNKGHKPRAEHFDLESMELGLLPTIPKTTRLAVYGDTSEQAGKARDILLKNGFTRTRSAGTFEDVMANRT